MLRHLNVCRRWLAHVSMCGGLACGSAAPIDIGIDYIEPEASNIDEPSGPEPVPAAIGTGPPRADLTDEFDAFIDAGWERGEISPYCRSSFQACGGVLAGTWVVDDNCNPEIRSRDVLAIWGQMRLNLDETACWDAVQSMRWNWSGELRFERGEAVDRRTRAQRVEIEIDARCVSASFGLEEADSVSPEVCAAIEDAATACALANGVCVCTNRTATNGGASGVYGVVGTSVVIDANPSATYEYCVDGESLLWREKEGAQRQVVMRRTENALPGEMDPIGVPR